MYAPGWQCNYGGRHSTRGRCLAALLHSLTLSLRVCRWAVPLAHPCDPRHCTIAASWHMDGVCTLAGYSRVAFEPAGVEPCGSLGTTVSTAIYVSVTHNDPEPFALVNTLQNNLHAVTLTCGR